MLAPNPWKPTHSGARLTIKVPMPCHPFLKCNINSGIDDWDTQVWKLSESLDSMEIVITATFALKENSYTPSSQEGHPTLNNF